MMEKVGLCQLVNRFVSKAEQTKELLDSKKGADVELSKAKQLEDDDSDDDNSMASGTESSDDLESKAAEEEEE